MYARFLIHGCLILITLTIVACQTPPKPCECGQWTAELERHKERYDQCLVDKGMLRQQLKASEERSGP